MLVCWDIVCTIDVKTFICDVLAFLPLNRALACTECCNAVLYHHKLHMAVENNLGV